jgi:hypothetical protein
LRNGDKLIEVDGFSVVGKDNEIHFKASFASESTTWVVIRDGVRTEIKFDGTALYAIIIEWGEESLRTTRAVRD